MNSDLIIKDVDLEQLEEDLGLLDSVRNFFINMESNELTEKESGAIIRVLSMLKTWAESRKAEKEDEELVEKLTREFSAHYDGIVSFGDVLRAWIEMAVKEQRKRLGK